MPRDHARINLDLWGDDDWMDLSVDAQMLYLTLYTNPGLSFCGAGEWHPGRIAARAKDWTVPRVEVAAVELSRRLFVVIDTDTGEYLLRSWIKHDGLWRTPNMAVTVANARGELSSRTLRGVVVFEVAKIKKSHPESTSWDRASVQKMLSQNAVDAADLEPFNPSPNGGSNPGPNGGSKGGSNPYGENGVNPTPKGGPTPAPTPNSSSYSKESGARGSRLPDDWQPTSELVAQMRSEHPHVDMRVEHAKFVDYWRAVPGAKGRKADWSATWRNWVRRAAENTPRNGHTTNGHKPAASDLAMAAVEALRHPPTQRLELES